LNARVGLGLILLIFIFPFALSPQSSSKDVPPKALETVRDGNALYDKGSYEGAIKRYEAAINLAPSWYEPHYELAQTYSQMKRPEDARKEYELALSFDSNCWLCYQGLGNLADDLGNHDLALQQYEKAVAIAPNQAQPRYNLAVTYLRLKRTDDSISALKEAERLRPEYPSPYFLLGNVYYRQKRFYLAFDQLFQATKLEKTGPRFEDAKKLIDMQVTVDEKLDQDSMPYHMSYCLARTGSLSPEEYRKRFPGAETYVDDLKEEEYVLSTFATIAGELSAKDKGGAEFARLIAISKAGYLAPFLLSYRGSPFGTDLEGYQKKNPGRMEEFRKWVSDNKISLEPVHARCEVRWMGQLW
jgi:tetratricopeptide (TPR) repeat protein